MPIPKYNTIMLPLLDYLKDKKEHSLSEVKDYIYRFFKLNEDEKRELLPTEDRQLLTIVRDGLEHTLRNLFLFPILNYHKI